MKYLLKYLIVITNKLMKVQNLVMVF